MRVKEGTRVRLTGRAWGYASQNREVYARITFADHAYAKIDEREVLVSGMFVDGYEFEVAETEGVWDSPTPRGFRMTEIEFRDYPNTPPRVFEVQESSLLEPHLWVGPSVHDMALGSDPNDLTHMERAHLDVRAVRALRDALTSWLQAIGEDDG